MSAGHVAVVGTIAHGSQEVGRWVDETPEARDLLEDAMGAQAYLSDRDPELEAWVIEMQQAYRARRDWRLARARRPSPTGTSIWMPRLTSARSIWAGDGAVVWPDARVVADGGRF